MKNSYKVYLTKSSEAATLIHKGLSSEKDQGDYKYYSIHGGMVAEDCRIPRIYHNKGYFFEMLEYKLNDDTKASKYELIIC